TYTTNRLGTAYKYRSEKIRFNLRMSVENAILNSDREFPNPGEFRRTFNNILPSAMFRYNYSKTKNLRVYYRTYTRPPSVNQLQNVLNNTNPLKLYMGNPDLDQEYSHRLFLRYTSTNPETSRNFYAYVSGIYMNNQITNSTFIAGQDTLLAGGILLPRGAQLIQPVNMAGHYTINSFANYSLPVKKLKSNLNLNASAGHSRNPGLINNNINYSYVNNLGLGAVLASNISKNLDFTLSSRSNYNFVENTLREDMNTQFFNQVTHFRFNYIFWKNLVFRSDLNHQYFSGLAPGFNQSFFLWNLSVGKKIFKDQRGEIFLSVYDVLGQNNNIHRNVTETYIQDVQTNVLQRYFMLNFSYNLKSFKGAGLPDSE
ncbi:MAG: outer membrane beta-barrel protein, partial [Cytophagaceae bacterium]